MSQNQKFLKSDGDAWFKRNRDHFQGVNQLIHSQDIKYMLEVLKPFSSRINHVLEIGCSNAVKLETICQNLGAVGVGVEPSPIAVKAGNDRKKTAQIELVVGTGDKLPCEDASFDLVYFAFCLYLFDRNTLMQSLSEADRVLQSGGFLVITDFDPGSHHKRAYNHSQGLFSYKQDYGSFYTQSRLYYLVGKRSFSHLAPFFDESPDERVSTSILYKEIDPYPIRE
jgi:ubiquinone/menaquinone biosynthesis C-methylase UbiE